MARTGQNKRQGDGHHHRKHRLLGVIGALLLVAAVLCAGIAIWRYVAEQNAGNEYDQIAQSVATPSDGGDEPGNSSDQSGNASGQADYTSPIDFDALKQECPDAYAWIRVADTQINFPIVQATGDQDYYLRHSAKKVPNIAGAIFTQNLNKMDFSDPVTVVYGHNLTNGKMFSCLHQWSDRAYFEAHRNVEVYLPGRTLTYRIFAAYATDDSNILATHDFTDSSEFQRYLSDVQSKKSMNSIVTNDVTLDSDSRILVLSTCNDDHQGRFIVQAVLVS